MMLPGDYQQTTEFTCGPAALMSAMAQADPLTYAPSIRDEFKIWKESNTVYEIGTSGGHPGVSPFGMGSSALRRGFKVEVLLDTCGEPLLMTPETENGGSEHAAALAIDEIDSRQEFISLGGTIDQWPLFPLERWKVVVDSGGSVVVLQTEPQYSRLDGHYITVRHIDLGKDKITLWDPWMPLDKNADGTMVGLSTKNALEYISENAWCGLTKRKRACIIIHGKSSVS